MKRVEAERLYENKGAGLCPMPEFPGAGVLADPAFAIRRP